MLSNEEWQDTLDTAINSDDGATTAKALQALIDDRAEVQRRLAEAEARLNAVQATHTLRMEGAYAREHGEAREAVPYPEHTREWRGWIDGWLDADQDARLAEVEADAAAKGQALDRWAFTGGYCAECREMEDAAHLPGCSVGQALATDAGRAHLEADAEREALAKECAAMLDVAVDVIDDAENFNPSLMEDLEANHRWDEQRARGAVQAARAAGWLQEETT